MEFLDFTSKVGLTNVLYVLYEYSKILKKKKEIHEQPFIHIRRAFYIYILYVFQNIRLFISFNCIYFHNFILLK